MTPWTLRGNRELTLPAKTSTPSSLSRRQTPSRNSARAPRGSARIISTSGLAILSGIPGRSRPRTHVDQGRGEIDEFENEEQAIHVVLEHHVLEVVNPGHVERGVPADRSIR